MYLALIFSFFINPAVSMQQNLPTLISEIPNSLSADVVNDIELNEKIFAEFYTTVFPLLIAWDLAHHYVLEKDLVDDDYSDNYDFIDIFKASVPGNPYRHPSPDKVEFMPRNAEDWADSLEGWQAAFNFQKIFLTLAENILNENKENQSIHLKGSLNTLFNGLFKRPLVYQYEEFHEVYNAQVEAIKIITNPQDLPIEIRSLTSSEERALLQFIAYYKKRLSVFESFLQTFADKPFEEAIKNPLLKSYFLYNIQLASKLINVNIFQERNYNDTEVIVFDTGHNLPSRYLNYTKSSKALPENPYSTPIEELHAQSVAGIIAATDKLAQLRGVAPGTRVLAISDLNPETLEKIKQSKARVINISKALFVPSYCKINEVTKNFETSETPYCQYLNKFFNLIKEKDMVIVKSAGNEGLQLEKVDLETRATVNDLTDSLMGITDKNIIGSDFDEDMVDLTDVWSQIPQLKDRVVIVGNLWNDGVTISSDSSLPGAYPDDFIFAPSEGISTLGQSVHSNFVLKESTNLTFPDTHSEKIYLKNNNLSIVDENGSLKSHDKIRYSEIEKFGGTSGAAPRVSGVFVILDKFFPDLSMPEIRDCVLSTGDAFWFKSNNRFKALVNIAKKSGYNLKDSPTLGMKKEWDYLARIYGKGRINALNAYNKCAEYRENKRKTHNSISALNLIETSPSLQKR